MEEEQTVKQRDQQRGKGRGEAVVGECFVYSSGPSSLPSLWVLAGDYILGSGQRDGGGATRESGITSCRSTTPTLSHSKNRTNIKKEFPGGSAPRLLV